MARRKKIIEEVKLIPQIKQARFYCTPGLEPIGYRCGDLKIIRNLGESLEELRKRCRDVVQWPDAETVHVFTPIHNQ